MIQHIETQVEDARQTEDLLQAAPTAPDSSYYGMLAALTGTSDGSCKQIFYVLVDGKKVIGELFY